MWNVPVSVTVPGRPPTAVCDRGHAFSADVSSESKLSSEPSTSNTARLRRAGGLHPSEAAPPPCMGSRRFRTSGRVFLPSLVGTTGRSVPPRSSRRNAPRGPISSRSRNLRYAPVSRGAVLSCDPRGRRGGFAAPAAAATGLCCGPRYAAIWRSQATAISRRLAALATRPSAPAARRLKAPGGGTQNSKLRTQNSAKRGQAANSKFEIRNSKSNAAAVVEALGSGLGLGNLRARRHIAS